MSRLSVKLTKQLNEPGRYSDGGGLYLHVRKGGSKQWLLRTTIRKRRVDIGLGSATMFSLAEARDRAFELKKAIKEGRDPLTERRTANGIPTFEEASDAVFEKRRSSWTNKVHANQWQQTMRDYVFPVIGTKSVADVRSPDILRILSPIWIEKRETARRVKRRMKAVFDWAQVAGFRQRVNPVDGIEQALPNTVLKRKHHSSLPWQKLPEFINALKEREAVSARALELVIFSACRSGEVRGARWDEFNIENGIWTIPENRMKAAREHRVPLNQHMIRTLDAVRGLDEDLLFPSNKRGVPLSNMVFTALLKRMGYEGVTTHGFRSTFRDWCSEQANADWAVAEHALAHNVGNATERAYARSDLIERRRTLMEAWAEYACSG